MKKLIFASIFIFCSSALTQETSRLQRRVIKATEIIRTNDSIAERAIPRSLLRKSTCIATFPEVVRAGFVFGAKFGRGIVSCRTLTGATQAWSNPIFVTLTGMSWGLQIGADATELVLVFVNPRAIEQVNKSQLQLGGDASLSVGPLGRDAVLGTDFLLRSEVYSYSMSRGLYAGLTLNGAYLNVDEDSNQLIYGQDMVTLGLQPAHYETTPSTVWPYVEALDLYIQ